MGTHWIYYVHSSKISHSQFNSGRVRCNLEEKFIKYSSYKKKSSHIKLFYLTNEKNLRNSTIQLHQFRINNFNFSWILNLGVARFPHLLFPVTFVRRAIANDDTLIRRKRQSREVPASKHHAQGNSFVVFSGNRAKEEAEEEKVTSKERSGRIVASLLSSAPSLLLEGGASISRECGRFRVVRPWYRGRQKTRRPRYIAPAVSTS